MLCLVLFTHRCTHSVQGKCLHCSPLEVCFQFLIVPYSETEVFHKSSKPALPYNFQLKSADSDKGQYGHLFFKGKKEGKIFLAYLSFSDSNVIRTHNHLVHK